MKTIKVIKIKSPDEIIFPSGSVPVAVAARVYGASPEYIRAGIISGRLDIGHASQNGRRLTDINQTNSKTRTRYYISPAKLYADTGYIWKGERK